MYLNTFPTFMSNSSIILNSTSNSSLQQMKTPAQIALVACLAYALNRMIKNRSFEAPLRRLFYTPKAWERTPDIVHPDPHITEIAAPERFAARRRFARHFPDYKKHSLTLDEQEESAFGVANDGEEDTVLCLDYVLALIECLRQNLRGSHTREDQSYTLDLLFWRRAQLTPEDFVGMLKEHHAIGLSLRNLPSQYSSYRWIHSSWFFSNVEDMHGLDFLLERVPVNEANDIFGYIRKNEFRLYEIWYRENSTAAAGSSMTVSARETHYLSNLLKDQGAWAKDEGRPTLQSITGGESAAQTRQRCLLFLGIRHNDGSQVTRDQLKKQYRKLALQYHPDRSPPELKIINTRRFQMIERVYNHLKTST